MLEDDFSELKEIFLQLWKIVKEHGGQYYSIQLNIISDIIKCINSDIGQEKKEKYILNCYKSLYPPKGGLSEFYIHDDDFQTRLKLNKPLDDLKDKLWKIMRRYI